jgi:trypsin-like peptidase
MSDQRHRGLGGEADPNSWHFAAAHGPLPNPVGHTFPLLTHDDQGCWRLIGTGFYISGDGLFVTAAHVIEDVLEDGRQAAPLAIMHLWSESGLFGPESYLLRPIIQCWVGDTADIVLGVAAHATNNETGATLSHWRWPLSWEPPTVGQSVATYAFPNHSIEQTAGGQTFHFQPDLYPGSVLEIDEFRDRLLVPYPYMHVSFDIHGAASGGPVVAGDAVVGVNCRFMKPGGPGVVAQIRSLQDSFIDDAVLSGESVRRRVQFSELVEAGAVTARGYVRNSVSRQEGHLVRLDQILPSARGPTLAMVVSY